MPTKTISLELDAYEKLRRAKKSSRESFSSVVRRARFGDAAMTACEALAHWSRLGEEHGWRSEEELDRLDAAQENPAVSESEWEK